MDIINIEIKAYCKQYDQLHQKLIENGAVYKGMDHQVDTYFNVRKGRLKLRTGNIEHALIYYNRPEVKNLKRSEVVLNNLHRDSSTLLKQLTQSLGIKAVVDKKRKIYFIDHVKFHLDSVHRLGYFVEIEAIGRAGEESLLTKQCTRYMELLGVRKEDLIDQSYSDMILGLSQDQV